MYDVIIVGAGLAGSSLASLLAQHGWEVLLLERDRFPRHKVCGEFLSPEVRQTLHRLGLLDRLDSLGPARLDHAELVTPDGARLRAPLPGRAWGLSRYRLDAALAEAAVQRGAALWTGVTVTGWRRSEDQFEVQFRRQRQSASLAARAIVMSCGRHSLPGLPPDAGSRSRRFSRWERCVGIKCHVEPAAMPPQVELYFFPGGYIGINPIEGDRANVCALITYQAFGRAGKSPEGVITAAANWNPAFGRRLAGTRLVADTVCAVAPVDTKRQAAPWSGVACLGDTAAMIPPLCGDGMAMAMRSAELCAPLANAFLSRQISLAAWEARYVTAWRAEFSGRFWWAQLLQAGLGWGPVRAGLVAIGQRLPALTNYLVRATRGQTIQIGESDHRTASAL